MTASHTLPIPRSFVRPFQKFRSGLERRGEMEKKVERKTLNVAIYLKKINFSKMTEL